MSVEVQKIGEGDLKWVRALLRDHWASEIVITRGRIHRADQLPGFIAVDNRVRVGLLTYRVQEDECEIITVNALRDGQGIGTILLKAVRNAAAEAGCRRLWLITTNDNVPAMRFYEKRGFSRIAVHRNAVEASRRIKPEIPRLGVGGVPICDEVEYELRLEDASV